MALGPAVEIAARPSAGNSAREESAETLKCLAGPLYRKYAGAEWLIYACEDGKSVLFTTQIWNPAHRAVLLASDEGQGYVVFNLTSEDEKRALSQAAFAQVSKLSDPEIAVLFAEAQAVSKSR